MKSKKLYIKKLVYSQTTNKKSLANVIPTATLNIIIFKQASIESSLICSLSSLIIVKAYLCYYTSDIHIYKYSNKLKTSVLTWELHKQPCLICQIKLQL